MSLTQITIPAGNGDTYNITLERGGVLTNDGRKIVEMVARHLFIQPSNSPIANHERST